MLALAEPTLAQHSFERTLTVDPKVDAADFDTIQGAIDSLDDPPAAGIWTILIYSGTYDEAVTLNGDQERINLVGIDRDAVIIAPTGTDENGITITSGTEISRNNTIRNLTIRTTDGHGIEIVKGTGALTPKDIIIEDCVIEADGTGKQGVLGSDADAVSIRGCSIASDDDVGITVGNGWTLDRTLVQTTDESSVVANAVVFENKQDLFITRSHIMSVDDPALALNSGSSDCRFEYTSFTSLGVGGPGRATIRATGVTDAVFFACTILNDATARTSGTDSTVHGFFSDEQQGGIRVFFDNCDIHVLGNASTISSVGVKSDKGPVVTLRDCSLWVSNEGDPTDPSVAAAVYGVQSNGTNGGFAIVGGSITTSSSRERETEVYDVSPDSISLPGTQRVSGTRMSKWRGSTLSAERRRSVIQRTLVVSPSSSTAVLLAKELTTGEQEVTAGITDPDVYRAVTITGSLAGMTQDVYIIGTNFAGNAIAEKITLSGIVTVVGNKPFMTVTKIILPVKLQLIGTQTVSVGTSAKLGLQFPIGADTDVIQFGVKASAATSYTITAFTPSTAVDVDFATFTPPPITNGDSFEFVVLSSQ